MASATSRSAAMKSACALLCAAATAAALLALRQQRLLAARDMLSQHEQAMDHRITTQRLRAEIALLIDPQTFERRAKRVLPLAVIEPALDAPQLQTTSTTIASADAEPMESRE